MSPQTIKPWLIYSYPWMPFPRRLTIYLRERNIPSSLITVVPVSDPQVGNLAPSSFPPRPHGSLPLLVIHSPTTSDPEGKLFIRQSVAIMEYIDEHCDAGLDGFPKSRWGMRGDGMLDRARERELMALAEELTVAWNPVRMFGTGAGTMNLPGAAKEMLEWVHRTLATIEEWFAEKDFGYLRESEGERAEEMGPSMADIVLYQFFEFVRDCYGVDLTKGSGEKRRDVYGKEVVRSYAKLADFFESFGMRQSVKRVEEAGEIASSEVLERMQTWWEGVL